ADDAPCSAPTSTASGVSRPAGADAGTFTYQCTGPYAGLWTNAYYTYNPATGLRTALYSPDYSYDCATNKWSMTNWNYSPASGGFVQSRIAPTTTPSLPTGCAVAAAPATSTSPTTSGDPSSSSNPSGSTIAG